MIDSLTVKFFISQIKYNTLLLVLSLALMLNGYAQSEYSQYPKTGEKITDYEFYDVINYKTRSCNTSDFRGQWLVLDFWGRTCASCIQSFPKMNKLSSQFAGKAKIIMVGMHSGSETSGGAGEEVTKKLYALKAKKHGLTFTVAFDSVAGKRFDVGGLPLLLIINPEGELVAKALTLDSSQLAEFINGKIPAYLPNYLRHENGGPSAGYNYTLPFLTSARQSNGGVDTAFLARSILCRWNPATPWRYYGWKKETILQSSPNSAEALGVNLSDLLLLAFTGEAEWGMRDSLYTIMSRKLIIETTRPIAFKNKMPTAENTFSYSVTLPPTTASPALFRKTLLEDIERTFQIKCVIEKRMTEVYHLVVTDERKLRKIKSKGGERSGWNDEMALHFKYKNFPWKDFFTGTGLGTIFFDKYGRDFSMIPPVLDKTGINFNIDLDYKGADDFMSNPEVMLDLLHKCGLDLIKTESEMQYIVVKDATTAALQ